MVARMPMLKARNIARVLLRLGFAPVRQVGSHVFYAHSDGRVTTIPNHSNKDIGRGLLRKIMRDVGISPADFLNLL